LTGTPHTDDVIISVLFFFLNATPNGRSSVQHPSAERIATKQFNLDGRHVVNISQWLDAKLEECRQKVLTRAS